MLNADKAIVLLSGGQDSTTCLAWALEHFQSVETIGFQYGQRHAVELQCRNEIITRLAKVKDGWQDRIDNDHLIDLSVLGAMSKTALTEERAIQLAENGLPNTFVPGRNLIFLTFAAITAYRRGIKNIIMGVCETDYSGYPDCRDDTLKALQVALNLGMSTQFLLHTPLMWTDKANTWNLAENLGGQPLIDLITEYTHTCYLGDRSRRHAWGYGCGGCPACDLRSAGFQRWQTQAQSR